MLFWSCSFGVLRMKDIHGSLMTFSQVIIAVANGETTLQKTKQITHSNIYQRII